ncbi:MAG: cyclomaltodextrinase C-terminal domain-containing protein [Paludibacteraceae bacterium]|nr:cyclomaltodextrinase C-terminal domain-containing protein [Paludibacteraceae bacterium]
MKKIHLILFASLLSLAAMAAQVSSAPRIERAEPLSWWTDMHTPLTLMLQGADLADGKVTIYELKDGKTLKTKGLKLVSQHNAESRNYLFLDLKVKKAGTYLIEVAKGDKKATCQYTINTRRPQDKNRQSFNSSDLVYLIMSDRFVDGDKSNNSTPDTREKCNKQNVHGRFGGDIAGIMTQLDHIADLGATAIWPTPMLGDDEAEWSYHGYACSDYYHIDPRYGTNELYCQLVEKMHEKGLKMIMDMVPNHCGAAHWWMKDLPYQDWINQFPEFTNTPNAFSTNYDINASQYDRKMSNRGWFDRPMPDMNLENKDLLKYFQQWAVWWIEYANLDGLRVDTYPYIEKQPAAEWLKAIREEYPWINIVGECWTRPASNVAYWQSGVHNYDGFDSNLPTVMDFPVEEAIRQALENDGSEWGGGLTRVYDAVAADYLYADVNKLLLFLGNHDMDRFADIVKDQDPRRVKLGYVLLATMRGIPQVFAGDEYAMHSSDRSLGHSTLRMPLPLGTEVTAEMQDMYDFQKRLFNFRKSEPAIHTGRTMHFITRDNTYGFFRYNDQTAVFVYLNASEEERQVPVDHYEEILSRYIPEGTDVLSGKKTEIKPGLTVAPLSALVVKLNKK